MSAPDRTDITSDSALFSEHLSDAQPRRVKPPNPVPVVRTLKPPVPDRTNVTSDSALFSEHLGDAQPRRVKPPHPVPVVRTLKPPPEIWELVPVNEFKPVDSPSRSSSNWSHPIILAVVVGLVGAGVLYFWKLGSPQSVTKSAPTMQTAPAPQSLAQQPPQTQTNGANRDAGAAANQAATSSAANPLPATPAVSGAASSHAAPGNPAPAGKAVVPATSDVNTTVGLTPAASLSGLGLSKKPAKKAEKAAGVDVSNKQPASSPTAAADTPTESRPNTQPATTDRTVKTAPVAAEKSASEKSAGATDNEKKGSTDGAAAKPKSNTSVSPQSNAPAKAEETPKPKVIKWPS
jgi:hypothetical protein